MSEEMQTNNTISRKRVQADMVQYERLTVKNLGDFCIVSVDDLKVLDAQTHEIQELKNEKQQIEQQLIVEKNNNVEVNKMLNEAIEIAQKLGKEKQQFAERVKQLEFEKIQLEESYKALNAEYSKLKVFKENAGRGRQNVLTPQQVGRIRAQSLEGWSVRQSHESLLDMGVEVSYETVRKVVAEMTPKEIVLEDESVGFDMSSVPVIKESNVFGQASETEKQLDRFNMPTISSDFRKRD